MSQNNKSYKPKASLLENYHRLKYYKHMKNKYSDYDDQQTSNDAPMDLKVNALNLKVKDDSESDEYKSAESTEECLSPLNLVKSRDNDLVTVQPSDNVSPGDSPNRFNFKTESNCSNLSNALSDTLKNKTKDDSKILRRSVRNKKSILKHSIEEICDKSCSNVSDRYGEDKEDIKVDVDASRSSPLEMSKNEGDYDINSFVNKVNNECKVIEKDNLKMSENEKESTTNSCGNDVNASDISKKVENSVSHDETEDKGETINKEDELVNSEISSPVDDIGESKESSDIEGSKNFEEFGKIVSEERGIDSNELTMTAEDESVSQEVNVDKSVVDDCEKGGKIRSLEMCDDVAKDLDDSVCENEETKDNGNSSLDEMEVGSEREGSDFVAKEDIADDKEESGDGNDGMKLQGEIEEKTDGNEGIIAEEDKCVSEELIGGKCQTEKSEDDDPQMDELNESICHSKKSGDDGCQSEEINEECSQTEHKGVKDEQKENEGVIGNEEVNKANNHNDGLGEMYEKVVENYLGDVRLSEVECREEKNEMLEVENPVEKDEVSDDANKARINGDIDISALLSDEACDDIISELTNTDPPVEEGINCKSTNEENDDEKFVLENQIETMEIANDEQASLDSKVDMVENNNGKEVEKDGGCHNEDLKDNNEKVEQNEDGLEELETDPDNVLTTDKNETLDDEVGTNDFEIDKTDDPDVGDIVENNSYTDDDKRSDSLTENGALLEVKDSEEVLQVKNDECTDEIDGSENVRSSMGCETDPIEEGNSLENVSKDVEVKSQELKSLKRVEDATSRTVANEPEDGSDSDVIICDEYKQETYFKPVGVLNRGIKRPTLMERSVKRVKNYSSSSSSGSSESGSSDSSDSESSSSSSSQSRSHRHRIRLSQKQRMERNKRLHKRFARKKHIEENEMKDVNENKDDDRPLKCDMCRYTCKIPGTMRKHKAKEHPDVNRNNVLYSCTQCSYVNTFKEDMKKHIDNKHDGRCGYNVVAQNTARNDYYNNEYDFFQVEIPYPCRYCNYVTTMGFDMQDHMYYRHRDILESLNDSRRDKRKSSLYSTSNYYICRCCDFQTRHPDIFDEHVSKSHAKRTYRCSHCSYTTLRKCEMNKHKAAIHETDSLHVCNLCSFRTTRKSHLSRHILLKHTNEYVFSCRYCSYKTTSTKSFSHHVEMEHT